MKIDQRLNDIKLIDYYGSLLTDHQLKILKDYYYDDLSMSEIASANNITRSAVQDLIKRSLNQLKEYETKLHLIAHSEQRSALLNEIVKFEDPRITELVKQINELE